MGTIVYESLLRLFLDEGRFTLDEIIDLAHERYAFDKEDSGMNLRLNANMLKRHGLIKEHSDKKLERIGEFPSFFYIMTGGPASLPEGHFGRTNPNRRRFYTDLNERYVKMYPPKKEEDPDIDSPF